MVYELNDILDTKYVDKFKNAMPSAGIDIGSRGAKAAMIYKGKLYTQIVPSGVSSKETAKALFKGLVDEAGILESSVKKITGTGYGSIVMDFPEISFKKITEITCHALGAHYLHSDTKTVIDIGGQDSKAIRVNTRDGKVVDFVMNDKCAAGTGRFLEKVAQILGYSLDEMGSEVLKSTNPAEISSQCVVFAESEVISLRAAGITKEDIAYGIHLATARRIKSLLKRTGFEKDILFTGGVSNNIGMRQALEQELGVQIEQVNFDLTFAGALGAAISGI